MVKRSNKLSAFADKLFDMFDHFVGLSLKGLIYLFNSPNISLVSSDQTM